MPTKAATAPSTPAPRPSFMAWFGRDPTATMLGALIALAVIFFSALAPFAFPFDRDASRHGLPDA